jgi:S1-C subfamily serine protease
MSSIPGREVVYSAVKPTWIVMSGKDRDKNFYVRYHRKGSEIRGFSVNYSVSRAEEMSPIVNAMSNVFRASADANDPLIEFLDGLPSPEDESAGVGTVANDEEHHATFSGSGFAVSKQGAIVTNAHMVEGCQTIEVRDETRNYGKASLLAVDAEADLAVLKLSEHQALAAARIRTRPPELGQEVVILGYPLSDLMGNAISVTTGLISSLSGLGGDRSFHTLTANIQPGNSGGPILDMNGHVIGVAVAKFNEEKMLQAAGTTGANIGFAVSAKTLLDFLRPFEISEPAEEAEDELSVQAIAAQAKDFTVQVVCRH